MHHFTWVSLTAVSLTFLGAQELLSLLLIMTQQGNATGQMALEPSDIEPHIGPVIS